MPKYQYFDGIRFCRDDKSGYYRCSTLRIDMHQYVWKYYNGDIPTGYEIHHIDFDKSNNDISNLQLLQSSEHKKLHGRLLTEKERNWRRNNVVQNAVPKAVQWHKSNQGLDWHKKQVSYRKDNRKEISCICVNCHKVFIVFSNKPGKYCSGACTQKYRRKTGMNKVERECPVCGELYMTDKYSSSSTCSRNCGVKLGWLNRKGK